MAAVLEWKMELFGKTVSAVTSTLMRRLGLMTMRIALAKLVWNYDFKLSPGQGVPGYFHRSLSAGQLRVKLEKVQKA